jgi:hypothetical protein
MIGLLSVNAVMPLPATGIFEAIITPKQFAADCEGGEPKTPRFPDTVGFRIPKALYAPTTGEIEDAVQILPDIAQA